MVHVMTEEARWEYALERRWAAHGQFRKVAPHAPTVQTLSTMRLEESEEEGQWRDTDDSRQSIAAGDSSESRG